MEFIFTFFFFTILVDSSKANKPSCELTDVKSKQWMKVQTKLSFSFLRLKKKLFVILPANYTRTVKAVVLGGEVKEKWGEVKESIVKDNTLSFIK